MCDPVFHEGQRSDLYTMRAAGVDGRIDDQCLQAIVSFFHTHQCSNRLAVSIDARQQSDYRKLCADVTQLQERPP